MTSSNISASENMIGEMEHSSPSLPFSREKENALFFSLLENYSLFILNEICILCHPELQ